jgi:hypothetical protein
MLRSVFLMAPLALSGCATARQIAPPAANCPIVASSDWAAWVSAMPGPNARPTLIVTGKATVPTGGYGFDWAGPVVAESNPVQVTVQLRPIAPQGMATQAVVTHDVRGQWPSEHQVGSVHIVCGGQQLALISPVETAH